MGAVNPRQTRLFLMKGLVLCLLLAGGINAESSCKRGCTQSDDGLLKYAPGNVYEYSFDSVMTVGLDTSSVTSGGGETDDTSLKLQGVAKVFAEGNCGYTLQLNSVKVSATKESVEKKLLQSIQKPVHFSMVGGKLEPEICADPDDNTNALNVKRAIISLLSANTDPTSEVDVFGQCPTHTSVSKLGATDVVTKVRNLNACSYREKISSGIVNGIVNDKAGIKSSHLLRADYAKESKIVGGILEHVHLAEEYKVNAAAKGSHDVRAKVVTNLKIKNHAGTADNVPVSGNHAVSIIFQKPVTYVAKNIAALKTAMSELVQLLEHYVKKDSAKGFVELIRLMRNADADTLLELAAYPHPNKILARKVYLDALFRTGTAESAKAIMKQLQKMENKEKFIAIVSLNLVQNVDKDTLAQAMSLLAPNSPKEAFLAVGNLVAKYCQINGCSHGEIDNISKKFTDSLKHCKANTKKDEERIIYALKGIANAEHLATGVANVLSECAATGRSNRIRVAALQAFSAASCQTSLQDKAMALLRDHNEDSELRIEAYLAAITCVNGDIANEIADIVNNEPVYQVGGFITSNLRAIRDSTDATREKQRYHLGNIRVTKQFPKDFRRYSFNNEFSYNFEATGFSASSDYKLIYSQHGFLPRSARLNVTTEVMGTNFNVFEASIRQENLENVLEYYVGPKGLLNKDFDEIMKLIEVGSGGGARARRSIAEDSAKFGKKYKTYGSKNVLDLNVDMSLKLFGSELLFLSLGDHIPSSLDDIIKHFSTAFDEVKKQLSSFSKEFVVHNLFLDMEFVYPTGLGIPLELKSQGFAANKLDFAVNIDVDKLLEQDWQHAKYRLKVVPSVDINVNVQLGFNAFVLATGVRVTSSMHSAVGSDVNFALTNEGNGFNMEIDLPREKIELIDFQVQPEFYLAEQDKETKSITLKGVKKHKNDNDGNCFNQLEDVGVNLCFSSSITEASAKHLGSDDLVRPLSFSLYLQTERKYNIQGTHIPATSTGSQLWKLDFSTPNSKEKHETSLSFELGTKPRTYGRVAFQNPQYNLALEAGINNDNKELVLYAQYENNNDVKKNRIGFEKHGNEYRPIIEIQDNKGGVVNEINGYRADGKVVVQSTGEKQARYSFENFQVMNKDNERIVVNGWADVGPAYLKSELHVAPGRQAYFVQSNVKLDNGEYNVGFYVNDEKTPQNVIGGEVQLKVGQQDYTVHVNGKAAGWEADSSTAIQYVLPEGATAITSSKFKNEITVKHKGSVFGSLKVNSLTEPHILHFDVELLRGKKYASAAVKFNANQRTQGDYTLEINGKWNKDFVDLIAKCDVNGNHYVLDNVLTTSWGTALTVKGELGQRYTSQDIHINLQGTAQFSGKEKPTQWILKVIGAPEKTSSEFKLVRDNSELIKYNGELQHPQDKLTAGKVNVVMKNVMSAKADFKVAKNGKGELTATIETQKTEQKHKVDLNSKFHVQMPKVDVEVTMTLDGDPSKKIYFKTENVLDRAKFFTKNIVDVANKQYTFDANGVIKGDAQLSGEVQGNFVLKCPEGNAIEGSIKRKLTTNAKTGNAQGNVDLQLNCELDGKKRSFAGTIKIDKFNWKTKEIAQEQHYVVIDHDGRKAEVNVHIKNLPKGENKMVDFGFKLAGNMPPTPVEISVVVDDYDKKHAVYRVAGKYGQHATATFNGKYNLGERGTPATYELQGNVQVPESKFKSFEITTTGKLLQSETTEAGSSSTAAEFHLDQKLGNKHFVRLNAIWKGSQLQGAYNFEVETPEMQGPLKVDGFYQREQQGHLKDGTASGKQKYAFNFNYGEKYLKSTGDLSYVSDETATVHYTLDSSSEAVKDLDVQIRSQKIEGGSYDVHIVSKNGANVYNMDTKIYRSAHKKGLDWRTTTPDGQNVVLVGTFEVLGERHAKWIMQVENVLKLDLNAQAEASYKSVDDFYIQAQWNSANLKLDHYDLNVRSQGKAITFKLEHAPGVIFSGSATYALKKEKNKATIEGQGQVQYLGKAHNTNFRLIYQHYDLTTDKEIGFSYTFNGNFGPKNGVSTLKITNKDFNVKLSVCEEKKQCTNVQIQSIVSNDEQEVGSTQYSLLVLVDLRELGYPYEFEFRSKTIQQGFKFQYSLESNVISNNNMKYKLVASVVPTASTVQLTLPSREMLLEAKHQFPENGQLFGHHEHSVAFYIDKSKKSDDVTRLIATAEISGVEYNVINIKSDIKFEHPSVRPLSVSGKFDANRQQRIIDAQVIFDIFRDAQQQIVASSRTQKIDNGHGFNVTTSQVIHSSGLGFQYEVNGYTSLDYERQEYGAGFNLNGGASDLTVGAHITGTKEHVDASVFGMNEEILHLSGNFNRQKYAGKFDTKLQIVSQKPVEFIAELQPTWFKLVAKRDGLMDVSGEVKLGKEAKLNILAAGKQLVNGCIALDSANFLHTTYNSNAEDIATFEEVLKAEVKKDTEVTTQRIKTRFQKLRQVVDQQVQLLKQSIPDFSQLKTNYENNINEIINELESDPALKQFADSYRKMYTQLAKIAGDVAKVSTDSYENLHKSLVALYEKFEEVLKETVMPAWEAFMVDTTKIVGELRVEIINLYTKTAQAVLAVLEKYGPVLKNYGKAVNDALKPINEAAQELVKVVVRTSEELIIELQEYIAKLPTFEAIRDELKEKLQKMKLLEKTLEFINNVFEQQHILPQTPESIEFLQKTREYLEAKLKQQRVNDEQVVQELFKLFIKAVRSALVSLEINAPASVTGLSSNAWDTLFKTTAYSTDIFGKLPALLSFRSSVFNFLLNENWENIFSRDHLKSWVFFPQFDLSGHLTDGRHVISFDGQYISFPGSCKYILAQDSVDNNFTVIAQLNNGKLKAIILTDRDDAFVEVNDSGVLKLNGEVVEFPQHTTGGMHAWRLFYTVWLRSEYGVEVMCTSDLKVCHVNVNGFYTSKTRGIFGNGNAEPYDDFIQFDGTIAPDYAIFGNGYALGKCNSVVAEQVDNSKNAEICNELFGLESPLAVGYLFSNVRPYREACNSAVAAAGEKDKESAACNIALAYGSALKQQQKFVRLPGTCLKCAGAAGQRELGQEFTVKIPNNKADVVFIVDLEIEPVVLGGLVAPAITEIRETLKMRGFTDVQIGVIAYNESQLYPALLTSDNGKLNYQGNLAELHLDGPKHFCLNCMTQVVADPKLLSFYEVLERVLKSIEPQSDEKAFQLALNYPFRAGAAKSIVGVRSNSVEFSNILKLMRSHIAGAFTQFDSALLHLIAPVNDMSLEGVPTEKLVGFNSRLVATLDGKDAKKRQKLQFQNDIGVDLVLDNGGWVFATQNFAGLNKQDQKKTLSQVTNSIADSLFKTEIVSECECQAVNGLHAQHKCTIKSSTFAPNKKVKAA